MNMTETQPEPDVGFAELTTEIVAAYVRHNSVSPADLPKLIADTHAALRGLWEREPAAQVPVEKAVPAVPIKKSVTPDYLICLEDGRKFRSLKRHLYTRYNLSPDEYREKWGLPADYPMVASSYSEKRSSLAKAHGLGRKPAAVEGSAKPPSKNSGPAL